MDPTALFRNRSHALIDKKTTRTGQYLKLLGKITPPGRHIRMQLKTRCSMLIIA